MRARDEFRALLPVLGVALLFPVPLLNFVADGTGRAFAFAYLYFGCALMAAECFRSGGAWAAKMAALAVALAVEVAAFCACYAAVGGGIDAAAVALAALTAVPALCLVPYLTQIDGRPYVAVALSALVLGCVKMAGCVAARVVYGPTARLDGEMAMSWREPNLLVWFCLAGGLLVSAAAATLSYRRSAARAAV